MQKRLLLQLYILMSQIQASSVCINCREGEGDISENETAAVTFAENGLETAIAQMKISKLSTVTFTHTPPPWKKKSKLKQICFAIDQWSRTFARLGWFFIFFIVGGSQRKQCNEQRWLNKIRNLADVQKRMRYTQHTSARQGNKENEKTKQSRRVGGWCADVTSNIVGSDGSDDKAPGSQLHLIPTQSRNYLSNASITFNSTKLCVQKSPGICYCVRKTRNKKLFPNYI